MNDNICRQNEDRKSGLISQQSRDLKLEYLLVQKVDTNLEVILRFLVLLEVHI